MTRESLKQRLVTRLWVRFHMSLILMACGMSAMLASALLLKVGVGSMLVRYPVAIAVAYGIFLLGVWLWVKYADHSLQDPAAGDDAPPSSRAAKNSRSGDWGLDLPSGGGGGGSSSGGGGAFSGKGGGFDGGGASASWAEGAPRVPMGGQNANPNAFLSSSKSDWAQPVGDSGGGSAGTSGGGKGGGFDIGLDIDFEGLVLVVLAIALVAAIAVASGYLVWAAPDILTEAAFGAVLAGGLARRSREQDAMGWMAGVVKKTWWPFAVVLVLAMAFAGWARTYYPQAHTFRQAFDAAIAGDAAKGDVTK